MDIRDDHVHGNNAKTQLRDFSSLVGSGSAASASLSLASSNVIAPQPGESKTFFFAYATDFILTLTSFELMQSTLAKVETRVTDGMPRLLGITEMSESGVPQREIGDSSTSLSPHVRNVASGCSGTYATDLERGDGPLIYYVIAPEVASP